ncbi:glycoside hydrolase family 65 protein [Microbacterium gilvum]|uniref:Glycosyl hydrolase family 65 protein n=1 Tax=Microbacterium gilvum TaxID=1336204 RepID=A0ABP9AHN7_9MICO
MTRPLPFDIAPWSVGLSGVDAERMGHRESVFALSNGHIGWRGSLDEGEPLGTTGAFLNGVHEAHPMPYAEDGYGYPEEGQSVVNVADGRIIRLLVDDEPFDVGSGELAVHEQRLDLRGGVLHRDVTWTSPAGRTVRIASTRLVSYAHRAVAAVRYTVTAVDGAASVTLLSELAANEPIPGLHPDDRVQAALDRPFVSVDHHAIGTTATLVHRTRRSGIAVAVAMDHVVSPAVDQRVETSPDLARTTIAIRLGAGEHLEVVKLVGHAWSADAAPDALRDRAEGAVADAARAGWGDLVAGQRAALDDYWQCADVVVDGQPRLQQAVRFALFHVFQASARIESRSVPGKGLTGAGYQGHTFWDFEAFVLPVLTATAPDAAAQALRWRHAGLDAARARARQLRLAGAAFPWRTIDGTESSGYWPASTAAFHVGADIAAAAMHHVQATGDAAFERDIALELLVETARLWMSLGHRGADGRFHIDGVTGPDEYSALVDDNVYTNLLAARNLAGAADAAERHPAAAGALGVGEDESSRWRSAAGDMAVPFDESRGVHAQSAGFTDRKRWDFAARDPYPLQDNHPYVELYRTQVVKQADLVLALVFAHDAFTPEEKAAAFAYYEPLTVRDSSLSAAAQSVIAAELGYLERAADYLAETALIDLDDLQGDTALGVHLAALAGVWMAVVAGFGGFRDGADGIAFAPRLPPDVDLLAFGIRVQGRTLRLEVEADRTVYRLTGGGVPLTVRHFGEPIVVEPERPIEAATPPLRETGPAPSPPPGREPRGFRDALAG